MEGVYVRREEVGREEEEGGGGGGIPIFALGFSLTIVSYLFRVSHLSLFVSLSSLSSLSLVSPTPHLFPM